MSTMKSKAEYDGKSHTKSGNKSRSYLYYRLEKDGDSWTSVKKTEVKAPLSEIEKKVKKKSKDGTVLDQLRDMGNNRRDQVHKLLADANSTEPDAWEIAFIEVISKKQTRTTFQPLAMDIILSRVKTSPGLFRTSAESSTVNDSIGASDSGKPRSRKRDDNEETGERLMDHSNNGQATGFLSDTLENLVLSDSTKASAEESVIRFDNSGLPDSIPRERPIGAWPLKSPDQCEVPRYVHLVDKDLEINQESEEPRTSDSRQTTTRGSLFVEKPSKPQSRRSSARYSNSNRRSSAERDDTSISSGDSRYGSPARAGFSCGTNTTRSSHTSYDTHTTQSSRTSSNTQDYISAEIGDKKPVKEQTYKQHRRGPGPSDRRFRCPTPPDPRWRDSGIGFRNTGNDSSYDRFLAGRIPYESTPKRRRFPNSSPSTWAYIDDYGRQIHLPYGAIERERRDLNIYPREHNAYTGRIEEGISPFDDSYTRYKGIKKPDTTRTTGNGPPFPISSSYRQNAFARVPYNEHVMSNLHANRENATPTSRNSVTSSYPSSSTHRSTNDPSVLGIDSERTRSSDYSLDSDLLSISDDSEDIESLNCNEPEFPLLNVVLFRLFVGFRTAAQYQSSSSGKSGGNITSSSTTNSCRAGRIPEQANKRNRQGHDSDEDADEDGSSKPPPKRAKPIQNEVPRRLFACPYLKSDPLKNSNCCVKKLTRIRDVKQHLHRRHTPERYCQRCLATNFDDNESLQTHIRRNTCEPREPAMLDGISYEQHRQLTRKSKKNADEQEQWFAIWDIIMPGIPRPTSVYMESEISLEIALFREYCNSQGPSVLTEEIESDPHWMDANITEEQRRLYLNRVVANGIRKLFEDYSIDYLAKSQNQARPSNCRRKRSKPQATQFENLGSSFADSGVAWGSRPSSSEDISQQVNRPDTAEQMQLQPAAFEELPDSLPEHLGASIFEDYDFLNIPNDLDLDGFEPDFSRADPICEDEE